MVIEPAPRVRVRTDRAFRSRPGKLPIPPTPFIGRELELAVLKGRLRQVDVRLLTLTGAGGVGKTRLALAIAAGLAEDFAQGIWFVDLAPLRSPALVTATIARTLGVREAERESPEERLPRMLQGRQVLLVLDNFEHLLPAAPQVAALLASCNGPKVLATSRAPLHIRGEQEFVVQSLPVPDPRRASSPDALAQVAATALFIQRARAVQPDFPLSEQTAPVIAQICARLDGLPLALELAAARSKVLPPQALLGRLERRLHLLTGGPSDLPPRQQTLRDTIAWSYDLLPPSEQVLLRRLAVFVGGWTLEGAEAVCGDLPPGAGLDLLDALTSLVDKNMLRTEESADSEPRFGMLETIREYALERLEASGELGAIRRRHAAYFLALAEQSFTALLMSEQRLWLGRLRREHDNLRAALTWGLETAEREGEAAEVALRIAGALQAFWWLTCHFSEGRSWLERALAAGGDAPASARARALAGAGWLARLQGDRERAAPAFAASHALYRTLGDTWGAAWSLAGCADVHLDPERRRALAEDSLALFHQAGDGWGAGFVLNLLGAWAHAGGDSARAAALLEEALARFRALDEWRGMAVVLIHLGAVVWRQGDTARAADLFIECLTLLHDMDDREGGARILSELATLARERGDAERAARLYAAAAVLREELGVRLSDAARTESERQLAALRARLGDEVFTAAEATGRGMTLGEALADARAGLAAIPPAARAPVSASAPAAPAVTTSSGRPAGLTARELEVLRLLASGLSNREIAEALVVTVSTVERHLVSIYAKLDVRGRSAATAYAHREGLA